MREREFRELAGYPQALAFAGRDWEAREDAGLGALLRYTRAAGAAQGQQAPGAQRTAILAAAHRLIKDCVVQFGEFSAAAFSARPADEDILGIVAALFRFYCCRTHWSAMRLLGYVSANMGEVDGKLLLAGGRGLAELSAREACNLALAICIDGRNDEDRMFFLEDLEFEGDPEGDAMKAVRQMQADRKAREGILGG
jgi:hypothetical protein